MLKKKSTPKPDTEDFGSLDSAVNELSKQTEALLGSLQPKAKEPKPSLPKKHAKVHAKTKSFDIIHDPKHAKKLKANLKTATPSSPVKMLEATAEEDTPKQKEVAAVVQTHKEGSLQPVSLPPTAADVDSQVPTVAEQGSKTQSVEADSEESSDKELKLANEAQSGKDGKEVAHNSLSFNDDKDKQPDVAKEPNSKSEAPVAKEASIGDEAEIATKKIELAQNVVTKPEAKDEKVSDKSAEESAEGDPEKKQEETEEESAKVESNSYHGELYANNLIKEAEPKGFQADDESKPAMFDTEEYHPELHDWSKLEHKSGLSWLVLALILVVAGAVIYFIVTGQKLPL